MKVGVHTQPIRDGRVKPGKWEETLPTVDDNPNPASLRGLTLDRVRLVFEFGAGDSFNLRRELKEWLYSDAGEAVLDIIHECFSAHPTK